MSKSETWMPAANYYDSLVLRVRKNPQEGNRYWQMKAVALVAAKCNIDHKRLLKDAETLFKVFNASATTEFTEEDKEAALEAYYDPEASLYYRNLIKAMADIEYTLSLTPKLDDWYEEQERIASENGELYEREAMTSTRWLEIYARPSSVYSNLHERKHERTAYPRKKSIIEEWVKEHPYRRIVDCAKDTGIARCTIKRYWQNAGGFPGMKEAIQAYREKYPNGSRDEFIRISGYTDSGISKYWKRSDK